MSILYNRLKNIEKEKVEEPLSTEAEAFPIEGEIRRQKEERWQRLKVGMMVGGVIFVLSLLVSFGVISFQDKRQLGKPEMKVAVKVSSKSKPAPGKLSSSPEPGKEVATATDMSEAEKKVAKTPGVNAAQKAGKEPAQKKQKKIKPKLAGVKAQDLPAKKAGSSAKTKVEVAELRQKEKAAEAKPQAARAKKKKKEKQKKARKATAKTERVAFNEFEKATQMYRQNRLKEALKLYKQALMSDPQQAVGYNNLGVIYFKQGKYWKSMKHFRMAVELNPHYAEAHYNLAVVLERLGDNKKALYHYLKFIELASFSDSELKEKVKRHIDYYSP